MSLSQVLYGASRVGSVSLCVYTEVGDTDNHPLPASFRADFSGNFFVQSLQGLNPVSHLSTEQFCCSTVDA